MYIQANHYTPINVKLHYHIQLQAEVGEGGDLHSRKKQIPTNRLHYEMPTIYYNEGGTAHRYNDKSLL